MISKENNFAYIDGANLHRGIASFGWKIDYCRFRKWLLEKYGVKNAYIFIGLIPKYADLYTHLQDCGFILVFKEVTYDKNGKPKGNCDSDLVLQVACDTYENKFDKAVIVSSDGDYAGLVNFLRKKQKISVILSPSGSKKCSILLKRTQTKIAYLDHQRHILAFQKEKAPDGDGTP